MLAPALPSSRFSGRCCPFPTAQSVSAALFGAADHGVRWGRISWGGIGDAGKAADAARGDLGAGTSESPFPGGPSSPPAWPLRCWHSAHHPVLVGFFSSPSISKCAFNQMLLKKRGRFVCYLNATFLISTILIICHFW